MDFLVEIVEKRAKELGFKKVKIRLPESQYDYWHPSFASVLSPTKQDIERNQQRMKKTYQKIAEVGGYKKRLNFFVKEL